MQGEELKVLLRPMVPSDINFVTNSWLRNFRKSWLVRGVRDEIYFANHHKILEAILPRAVTMVACDPEKPDRIYGWLCGEFQANFLVLHYVYVKDQFKCRTEFDKGTPLGVKDGFRELRPGLRLGTMMLNKMLEGVDADDLRGIIYTHQTGSGQNWLIHLWETEQIEHNPIYNPYFLFRELP